MRNNKVFGKKLNVLVEYEINGVNLDNLLNKLSKNIYVCNVRKINSKKVRLSIKLRESEKFFAIAEDLCYTDIVKVKEYGKDYTLYSLINNVGIIVGVIFFVAFSIYANSLVLGYTFTGTGQIYKADIKEFLIEKGITTHKPISQERLKTLSDELLASSDNFSFAEIQKVGNYLVINTALSENSGKIISKKCERLLSEYDGEITELKVYRGTPKFKVGDSVKKGDLLVDGYYSVEGDSERTAKIDVKATVVIKCFCTYEYLSETEDDDIPVVFAKLHYGEETEIVGIDKTIQDDGKIMYSVHITILKIISV